MAQMRVSKSPRFQPPMGCPRLMDEQVESRHRENCPQAVGEAEALADGQAQHRREDDVEPGDEAGLAHRCEAQSIGLEPDDRREAEAQPYSVQELLATETQPLAPCQQAKAQSPQREAQAQHGPHTETRLKSEFHGREARAPDQSHQEGAGHGPTVHRAVAPPAQRRTAETRTFSSG